MRSPFSRKKSRLAESGFFCMQTPSPAFDAGLGVMEKRPGIFLQGVFPAVRIPFYRFLPLAVLPVRAREKLDMERRDKSAGEDDEH